MIVHSELPAAPGDAVADRLADRRSTGSRCRSAPGRCQPGPCRGRAELDAARLRGDHGRCRRWTRACLASGPTSRSTITGRRRSGGTDLACPPARDGPDGHGRAHVGPPDRRGAPGQRSSRSEPSRARSCGESPPPCSSIPPSTGRSPRSPSSSSRAPGTSGSRLLLDPEADPADRETRRTSRRSPWSPRGGSSAPSSSRPARELDPSERELLRMFSESVALIVRNANLHRRALGGQVLPGEPHRVGDRVHRGGRPGRAGWSRGTPRPSACSAAEPTRRAASSSVTRCPRP